MDKGDKPGSIPKFRTAPGKIYPTLKQPDLGVIYEPGTDGRDQRLWICIADAKLAESWCWSDQHKRRGVKGLVKFLMPCRQLAAYGCLGKSRYVIPITPKEACFCRLVDLGIDNYVEDETSLYARKIGVQGTSVEWTASGPRTVTVLLGMVAWILSAMNAER